MDSASLLLSVRIKKLSFLNSNLKSCDLGIVACAFHLLEVTWTWEKTDMVANPDKRIVSAFFIKQHLE